MHILLIEEDVVMGATFKVHLTEKGHKVDWFVQVEDAYKAPPNQHYDVLLMDANVLNSPEETPIQALERFRRVYRDPYIGILYDPKVRSRPLRKVMSQVELAFPKPLNIGLIDREMAKLVHLSKARPEPMIQIGCSLYDLATQQLFFKGKPIKLSRRELLVFDALVRRADQVVSKEEMGEAIARGLNQDSVKPTVVEVYLFRLRRRLAGTGISVQTLRCLGYMLETGVVLDC